MGVAVPSGFRDRLAGWVESRLAQRLIITLILLNAVTLGLETSAAVMELAGPWLKLTDRIILSVFTLEVLVKLVAYRWSFWRNAWNVFDFLVVAVSLIPSSGPFSVLRVLRLLRLVSMVPKLRFIVESLLRAVPGIAAIAGLLVLVFYVFAIIAVNLFGSTHPQWFGSIGSAMYTLFQVMTLESWSMGISRPVMEVHPWAWVFFVPFILVATFTVLNLFIAIIVNAMQTMHDDQAELGERTIGLVQEENATLHAELAGLREQTQALQDRLTRMQQLLERRS